jgi:tRNA (cytidine32/uridine32-2'-O)-methyltransferase
VNKSNQIQIVLVEPSHPGNIGAVARAAKTMGVENLILVKPKSFPDNQATVRATGAVDVLERAVVCDSLSEAVSNCTFVVGTSSRERGLPCPEIAPRELGKRVWQELQHGSVAIVFGRESSGLSNEEMDLCQYATTIPTNWEFGSLNLAAAVQVICYEIFIATLDQAPARMEDEGVLASADELERFFEHLQEVLCGIDFLDPKQPRLLMRRLRHLYNRARLTQVEVNILRGVLSSTEKSMMNRQSN